VATTECCFSEDVLGAVIHVRRGVPMDASRNDADDHGKNIMHGLDMSGTMRSSPGVLSSSFMSKSESQIAQPL
jgi:hypothetical protein